MGYIYEQRDISPKLMTYGLFIAGLLALAYALIFQKLLMAFIIMCIPIAVITFIYSIRNPRLAYALYAALSYYLIALMRYSRHTGYSVFLDILLVYILICTLFNAWRNESGIHFPNAINILTTTYIAWILYILAVFANTPTHEENMIMGIREWILGIPVLYILSSLLADNPKMLKKGLILLGIFTITAFLKVLYQKYWWFDAAETEWLMKGSWRTHLLSSGIRYFSIFTDAGNFGAHMGMITIVYGIVFFNTKGRIFRLFCFCVAVMGVIGLFLSGTRSAIIIPLGGLLLYCLISKDLKIMLVSASAGLLIFAFFTYTNIGNGNSFIRRMRTAFHPTVDDSYNVRVENRKLIREYINVHPWGAGIREGVPRVHLLDGELQEDTIPPDAFYVSIWIQTGLGGLMLYIAIYAGVLLRCCYLIMFRIRNKELRNVLAALLCGVFGMWLNGYFGEAMGMPPNNFLIAAALAFVLNGPYIDKQLVPDLINNKNKKR